MVLMILKMSAIVCLYVVLTIVLWKRFRGRELTIGNRIALGIIYGIMAVLSTHFGVNYGNMMLNVRDLGPMLAGLFFDPLSGIIAGLIGGIERYIAGTYFGIAPFTRIACSISTCLAGFLAAFLNIYIFRGKKPSTAYAFFMGAAIEVFHMYVVFITHRNDMSMAFLVVKTCAFPMIIFSGLGLAITSTIIRLNEVDHPDIFRKRTVDEVSVAHRFSVWLFLVTGIVLTLNFCLNYNLQTSTAIQNAKNTISIAAEDIEDSYKMLRSNGNIKNMSNHVGRSGNFYIVNDKKHFTAGFGSYGMYTDELNKLLDSHEPGEFLKADAFGEHGLCMTDVLYDGSKMLVYLPDSEIFEERDIHKYETLLGDLLLFTVLYVLISLLVQAIVVNNLVLINESLNKITDGNLDEKVSVYESFEFASLSDDINQTVYALKGYIEAAEKRIEQELLLARTIQLSALPKNFDFNHDGFEIFATMDPAKEVGGDFYDFFFVDTNKLALVIADVSGKGIPAALFMMRSKTAIRSLAESGCGLADVLERVNNELCIDNEASMFVTVWMCIVDLVTGDVRCVNAGHEFPAIRHGEGDYELYKDRHSPPLGVMDDLMYREYTLHLEPGDCLYVYTDGVPEAIDLSEEQYGTDRMLAALNRSKDQPMTKLLPGVKADIDAFAGGADQFDDITMIGFRYIGC